MRKKKKKTPIRVSRTGDVHTVTPSSPSVPYERDDELTRLHDEILKLVVHNSACTIQRAYRGYRNTKAEEEDGFVFI